MTLLDKAILEKKFDVRLMEKYLARGVITAQEIEQALAALPDESEFAVAINLDEETSEDEDDSLDEED